MNAIGLMIACYIILRCIEICSRPNSSFSGKGGRVLTFFAAVICATIAGVLGLDFLISGLAATVTRGPGTTIQRQYSDKESEMEIDERARKNAREVEELLRRNRR